LVPVAILSVKVAVIEGTKGAESPGVERPDQGLFCGRPFWPLAGFCWVGEITDLADHESRNNSKEQAARTRIRMTIVDFEMRIASLINCATSISFTWA